MQKVTLSFLMMLFAAAALLGALSPSSPAEGSTAGHSSASLQVTPTLPQLTGTPAGPANQAARERSPILLVGVLLIVAVIMVGAAVHARNMQSPDFE